MDVNILYLGIYRILFKVYVYYFCIEKKKQSSNLRIFLLFKKNSQKGIHNL